MKFAQAINHLYFPGFSESNVFDAILETNERLKDVKGKKSILLLASGVDTFSKHTLDQTMKALRAERRHDFRSGAGQDFYELSRYAWFARFAHGLSAGRESVEDLRAGNWRVFVVSTI